MRKKFNYLDLEGCNIIDNSEDDGGRKALEQILQKKFVKEQINKPLSANEFIGKTKVYTNLRIEDWLIIELNKLGKLDVEAYKKIYMKFRRKIIDKLNLKKEKTLLIE